MNSKKRNQLIGFITLVLLALLFLPYVITDKSKQVEPSISLLPQVDIERSDIEIIESINGESTTAHIENDNAKDDDVASTNSLGYVHTQGSILQPNQTTEPVSTDNGSANIEKKYVIQLVALKNRQKIEELIALLRLNNYNAYTDPAVPIEGQATRLLVGHYPTKEQAEIVIIDLENLTKLKGFVTTK